MIERSNNINQKRNVSKEKINALSNKSLSVSSFKTLSFNYIQENSKVMLRIKPKTEGEYFDNNKIFEIKDNNYIEFFGSKNNSKIFKFDYIFNFDSQQSQIFEICCKEICDSLFEGYNGTIFTYGQIGSGKTYTMLGPDYTKYILSNSHFALSNEENRYISYMRKQEEEGKGLIPRAIEYLIDKKDDLCNKNLDANLSIELYCSFYEIFNDQIYDLFNNTSWININPQLKEKNIEGILKENLKKIRLTDKKGVFDLIKCGNINRQSFSFIMNTQSRSHAIFSININISLIENDTLIQNKSILNLVDLAGSENKAFMDNYRDKMKDTGKINKSFLGLGNVIQNVGENFIPYRDTKLTFLLKDSLGYNPKTCFIATISSLKKNLQETLFTVNFAQNIKKIKNKIGNKNINSKKNKLIEEENSKIITKEEIEKEKETYNQTKDEIINLFNILQDLGENFQEINKFKEKFKQNSFLSKYLNEDYEKCYKILLSKEKEIEELEKENDTYEKKINNLSIELIIKEQTYYNLIKKQTYAEKEFSDIKTKYNDIYEVWNIKSKELKEKNNILNKQKEEFNNLKNDKKKLINENNKSLDSKNNEIADLDGKIFELENNIKNNTSINLELEKDINNLKKEIEILNINYNKSEKDLLIVNDKLLDNNTKLNDVDNLLKNTEKLYKNKILNNKGDIIKLNTMINQSSSNEIDSKNRIFSIKNKIIEYEIYLKILNKTKVNLNNSLNEFQKRNEEYTNELNEKINLYNNLVEINRNLINKIDILNKRFEIMGGNNKKNKENETKSKIIKLKEENDKLSKDILQVENLLGNLYVKNNNIFQYHQNIDQKISEYKKLFNMSQKEIMPIIEKNELRKSLSIIENIRKNKNIKENEKLNLFTISLENAICLLKEKEELINNMKMHNENIRLKTISSVRENNVKTEDINILSDIEHRKSFSLGETKNTN